MRFERAAPDPALRRRIASGAVLAVLALLDIWLGGWWFAAAAAFAALVMGVEWARIVDAIDHVSLESKRALTARSAALFTPVLAIALFMEGGGVVAALGVLACGAALSGGLSMLVGGHAPRRALGPIYIGAPMLSLVWTREIESGVALVLWLFLCVWATDIGAYFVGRRLGGPRLAPRWSPGKTWSGTLGGMAAAGAIGALVALFVDGAPLIGSPLLAGCLALALAAFAQAGDLFESAQKRLAGIKDSGDLIPGHGGALDRLDGLMFAAPLFALTLAARGAAP